MLRIPLRIGILVLGLLLTAGLAYRAIQNEGALDTARHGTAAADLAAEQALQATLDLRASLHALAAPGQGTPFWSGRAGENLDALRQSLVTLDAAGAPLGASLSESLDGVDQLAAAEERARAYASRGQTLLAGDVVFVEARDLLSATITQVQDARKVLWNEHYRRTAALREEQAMLAGGAVALWVVIALLLAPMGPKPVAKDPAEWRNELAETIKKSASAPEKPAELRRDLAGAASGREGGPPQAAELGLPLDTLKEAAEICSDLSSLSDPGALEGALVRVSTMLNATGVIVWVASNDGGSLSPVATCGFDPKLVARIGKIPRDGANLTAAAFRENVPKVSPATATAPAALAIALCGPSGPAGVLSVELRAGQEPDEGRVALAGIVAAQLATLAMPISTPALEAAEAKRAAL